MPSRFFRIGLLILWVSLLAPALYAQTGVASPATAAESHPGTILVFPFENGSRIASLDWLDEGLSELTVERLQDRGVTMLTRQDRLAALEKMGLPDSARFSHATIIKIAGEADADAVVYGRFVSDGKMVTLQAWVL
jgi:TolB-like protein